ncbi:Pantothenate kinase 4 [Sparganum proliferum]
MSYASPIDISSFTELEEQHNELSECVFALDIGGSLAKLAYQTTFRYKVCLPKQLSDPNSKRKMTVSGPFDFYDYREHEYEGHKLCFIKFETRFIEACLDFIRENILPDVINRHERPVGRITGGGAFKFMSTITTKLPGIAIEREDEMESLVRGCSFLLRNIPDEVFIYDKRAEPAHIFLSSCMVDTYPFLLVNIGSGVSFLKVESDGSYCRVGGTSLGGGTFWGIGALFSGDGPSFDELLDLADQGNHLQVDMLVRDIYGGAYESLGLAGDVIASSFGLAARRPEEARRPADLVKALLIAVSNNIGQLACLYARLNNVQRILFGGFFIRGHGLTMEVISFAVRYWSQGKMKAMFLRHEGYLGAVGAFMKDRTQGNSLASSSTSWSESKVAGAPSFSAPGSGRRSVHTGQSRSSSGGQTRNPSGMFSNNTTYDAATNTTESETVADVQDDDSNAERLASRGPRFSLESTPRTLDFSTEWSAFELEHLAGVSLSAFPLLLSPADYVPDTWDLTQDTKARAYWLECFKQGVERIRQKAEESQADTKSDANARSQQFADLYVAFLNELADYPSGRGILTVRCILEAQQHFLRKLGFPDAFCHQKKLENSWALSFFPGMMERLKSLDWSERQVALARGILAGNIFDWGASEAVRFFMQSQTSVEGMASFDQTENKIPRRRFNPWVLPFAIECLEWGSKVILTANSDPAINDVTYPELLFLMNQVADLDKRFRSALDSRRLICVDSGPDSPCLDLRRVSQNLVKLVNDEKQGVERIRQKAEESQADTKSDANARSQQFADLYVAFLNELADYPSGRGILTVRCILEAQQHFLRKLGFPDAFCHQKKLENSWALSFFPGMMERLKSLDWSERQVALARGILAGNIFDWGASEAVRFFMQSQTSVEGMASFDQTENKIPSRPWLMDDFDRWIQRLALPEKRPHCVLIFCDNSGADLILGVLPFAIECLEWGSKVILTANSDPAINDVTYPELLFLMNQVADLDKRLAAALDSRRLICVDSGQNSPCLDLRRVSQNLVKLVNDEKVDLIVLEGMGRAVHTNLYARFCVDCLKIAVIKNSWLAGHLGGNLFSVIFKYEQYSSDSAPKPRPSDSS